MFGLTSSSRKYCGQMLDSVKECNLLIADDCKLLTELINCEDDDDGKSGWIGFVGFRLVPLIIGSGATYYGRDHLVNHRLYLHALTFGCITVTMCPYIFNLISRLTTNNFQKKWFTLCCHIRLEQNALKDYFNLVQDAQLIERKFTIDEKFLVKTTNILHQTCCTILTTFRRFTVYVRDSFKHDIELDPECNYISCIPIETFDELFQSNEENIFPLDKLKTLLQLVRLHQSEFLRRVVIAFLPNQKFIAKQSGNGNKCRLLNKIFDDLLCQMTTATNGIKESYKFYAPFLFGKDYNDVKIYANPTDNQLASFVRNSRVHLHTAILALNDIVNGLNNEHKANRFDIHKKLENVKLQIQLTTNLIDDTQLMIKKSDDAPQTIVVPHAMAAHGSGNMIVVEAENYIVEDQVFEMYVNSGDDVEKEYRQNYHDFYMPYLKKNNFCDSLFTELKTVLINKAEEHRIREAKALGISIDEIPVQLLESKIDESNGNPECRVDKKELNLTVTKSNSTETSMIQNSNCLQFSGLLAKIAAEKSKSFFGNNEVEQFGDDDENDDDQTDDCDDEDRDYYYGDKNNCDDNGIEDNINS